MLKSLTKIPDRLPRTCNGKNLSDNGVAKVISLSREGGGANEARDESGYCWLAVRKLYGFLYRNSWGKFVHNTDAELLPLGDDHLLPLPPGLL